MPTKPLKTGLYANEWPWVAPTYHLDDFEGCSALELNQ